MNLSQALKAKNRILKELQTKKQILERENSRIDTSESTVDREAVYASIMTLTGQLYQIKAAIKQANSNIWLVLEEMAELKSFSTFLTGLNTKSGIEKIPNYNGGAPTENKYTAFLKQENVDSELAKISARLDALQDAVDTYNATTEVKI